MDLRYPIGTYRPAAYAPALQEEWIADLRFLPGLLERSLENLDTVQLQTPYREGGWTVQQVVHHLADSHMNAFCRAKLILTEEEPTVRPYNENKWALTADNTNVPINISVTLLYALHARWVALLEVLQETDWQKTYYHPQSKIKADLWYLTGMYAWHGKHHVAHITSLRERKGW